MLTVFLSDACGNFSCERFHSQRRHFRNLSSQVMSLNLSLNIEWHLLMSYCLFKQERQKREAGFLEFRLNPVKQFCTAHLRSLTQIYGDNSDRKSNLTYKEQSNTDRVKFWRHIITDRVNSDTTVAITATNYILIVPNSGHWSWQITATNIYWSYQPVGTNSY